MFEFWALCLWRSIHCLIPDTYSWGLSSFSLFWVQQQIHSYTSISSSPRFYACLIPPYLTECSHANVGQSPDSSFQVVFCRFCWVLCLSCVRAHISELHINISGKPLESTLFIYTCLYSLKKKCIVTTMPHVELTWLVDFCTVTDKFDYFCLKHIWPFFQKKIQIYLMTIFPRHEPSLQKLRKLA